MKKSFLYPLPILFFLSSFCYSELTTTPKGKRWHELTGSEVSVGSLVGWGNYFPLKDKKAWKEMHRSVLLRECDIATLTCFPKGTWLESGQYDYSKFNEGVNWLSANNKKIIAHLVVGPQHYYPKWFKEKNMSKEELEAKLESCIKTIMESNDNHKKVDIWNIVNEALHGDKRDGATNFYRPCEWNKLGWEDDQSGIENAPIKKHPVWVRKSFEIARKYTKNKLEYRDNNCSFPNNRHYEAVYQLAKHLKAVKAPVDIIGFQNHMGINREYDYEGLTNNIKRYKALGYEVSITELDVNHAKENDEDFEKQRDVYYKAVKASLKGGVSYINFWGMRDDSVGKNEKQFGQIFYKGNYKDTKTYDPKPAYYGIQQALMEHSKK